MSSPIVTRVKRQILSRHASSVLITLTVLLCIPMVAERRILHVVILFMMYAGLGSAWNIVGGYGGQLSLGHAAFFGLGAYSVGILWAVQGCQFVWGVVFGLLLSLLVGALIGVILFRLHGASFALGTLAVGQLFRIAAENLYVVTGGSEGIITASHELRIRFMGIDLDPTNKISSFYVTAVAFATALIVAQLVRNSRHGLRLLAIRDDQEAARAVGVRAYGVKLSAFALSAAVTSTFGAVYAAYVGYVSPSDVFGLDRSLQIMLVSLLGGTARLWGPVTGALFLVFISEVLRTIIPFNHVLLYGCLLMIVVLAMPTGIIGLIERLRGDKTERFHDVTRA